MKILCLLFLSTLISFASNAETTVDEEFKYYYVSPNSKSEILSSLNRKSPIREGSEIYHGYAYSSVKWDFRWKYNRQNCWITSVNSEVKTTYTLPKLINSGSDVANIWDKWYPNLLNHEKGHHKLALRIASNIERKIVNMSSYPTCKELEKRANDIGYTQVDKLGLLNKKYDKRTKHGESQGASLFSYL